MASTLRLDESVLWTSPDAKKKWRVLVEAQLQVYSTKCQIYPEPFTEYPDLISPNEAEELCYKCPLLKLCYEFADANDEKWGIWGGINFTDKTINEE